MTARDLSRAAGLSDSHVSVILGRIKRNPAADIERDTLMALAVAGAVSMNWLATGEGKPDEFGDGAWAFGRGPDGRVIQRRPKDLDAEGKVPEAPKNEVEMAVFAAMHPRKYRTSAFDAARAAARLMDEARVRRGDAKARTPDMVEMEAHTLLTVAQELEDEGIETTPVNILVEFNASNYAVFKQLEDAGKIPPSNLDYEAVERDRVSSRTYRVSPGIERVPDPQAPDKKGP